MIEDWKDRRERLRLTTIPFDPNETLRSELQIANMRLLSQNVNLLSKHFRLQRELKDNRQIMDELKTHINLQNLRISREEGEKVEIFRTRNELQDLIKELREQLNVEIKRNTRLDERVNQAMEMLTKKGRMRELWDSTRDKIRRVNQRIRGFIN